MHLIVIPGTNVHNRGHQKCYEKTLGFLHTLKKGAEQMLLEYLMVLHTLIIHSRCVCMCVCVWDHNQIVAKPALT